MPASVEDLCRILVVCREHRPALAPFLHGLEVGDADALERGRSRSGCGRAGSAAVWGGLFTHVLSIAKPRDGAGFLVPNLGTGAGFSCQT